jgi:hypothetical protein
MSPPVGRRLCSPVRRGPCRVGLAAGAGWAGPAPARSRPARHRGPALAAATAITMDHSRAEALAGLAPHLPADLLAQALGSAPRTAPQALMALMERGQALHTQGSRVAYVRLLRDCLNGINQQACLDIVVSAVPAITETSGVVAIKRCAHAVTDDLVFPRLEMSPRITQQTRAGCGSLLADDPVMGDQSGLCVPIPERPYRDLFASSSSDGLSDGR